MGGLTTYSSFNYETIKLLQDGARASALVNFGVTTAACFVAGFLGYVVVRQLAPS
jgi:CrcB protein